MKKVFASSLLGLSLLAMVGCQARPVPMFAMQPNPQVNPIQTFSQVRAATDLVEAPGFKTGDKVKVKGPLWFKGSGKVHMLSPDAFDLEFSISSYHIRVAATRLDAQKVKVITTDYKTNRTVESIANYSRQGSATIIDIGAGQEVEKMTIRNQRNGYFEAVVVQPGRANDPLFQQEPVRGTTTLKFSRG